MKKDKNKSVYIIYKNMSKYTIIYTINKIKK